MAFDLKTQALIKKYDCQGPRYTSYPTVPQWKDQVTFEDFKRALPSEGDRKTIALYTHIPFCEEKCYFCACNVVILKNKEKSGAYIEALKKELALIGSSVPHSPVTQIHWGGGTPTYLNCQQIESLYLEYQKYFKIDDGAEISLEIDPRVTTLEQLRLLRQLGFNRVSLGVQDCDEKVQTAIHRNQTELETKNMFEWCKSLGFQSVNMDFVYGLPSQTAESLRKNLNTIIALKPDRIAFYNYAHVPWMVKWQKYIDASKLPTPDQKLHFLGMALELFEKAGYVAIGMDHFALPNDELVMAMQSGTLRRNFMGYTTQKDALLISFGMSSIHDLQALYIQNVRKLSDYYRRIQENRVPFAKGHFLTTDDKIRRFVIMELLCNLKLSFQDVQGKFNIRPIDYFKAEFSLLEEMVSDGLLTVSEKGMTVSSLGRLLIRNIGMVFDKYYQDARHPRESGDRTQPIYSRTI